MKMLISTATIVLGWIAIYSNGHAKTESDIQPEYREVSVNAVPATIKAALETAYSGTKLTKAYVNEKKEYKLELSVNNQKATVYTDANGNW